MDGKQTDVKKSAKQKKVVGSVELNVKNATSKTKKAAEKQTGKTKM